ncbi:MAG: hypothetical protein JKY65_32490 [Planctomycetes bacterium]|nr:hypothetical protein [Planctomycetota bacterium]
MGRSGKRHERLWYSLTFRVFDSWGFRSGTPDRDDAKPARGWIYVFKKVESSKAPGFYIKLHAELYCNAAGIHTVNMRKFARAIHFKLRRVRNRPKSSFDLYLDPSEEDAFPFVFVFSPDQIPYRRLRDYMGHAKKKRGRVSSKEAKKMKEEWARLLRRGLLFKPTQRKFREAFFQDGFGGDLYLIDFMKAATSFQERYLLLLKYRLNHLSPKRAKKRYLAGLTQQVVSSMERNHKRNDDHPDPAKYLYVSDLHNYISKYDHKARESAKRAEIVNLNKIKLIRGSLPFLKKNKYVGNGFKEMQLDYASFAPKGQTQPDGEGKDELALARELETKWILFLSSVLAETSQTPRAFRHLQLEVRKRNSWLGFFFEGEKPFRSYGTAIKKLESVLGLYKELTYSKIVRAVTGTQKVQVVRALKTSLRTRFGISLNLGAQGYHYQLETFDLLAFPLEANGQAFELRIPVKNRTEAVKLLKKWGVDHDLPSGGGWTLAKSVTPEKLTQHGDRVEELTRAGDNLAKVAILFDFVNLVFAVGELREALKGESLGKVARKVLGAADAIAGTISSLKVLLAKDGSRGLVTASIRWAGLVGAVLSYAGNVWDLADSVHDGHTAKAVGHGLQALGATSLIGAAGLEMGLGAASALSGAALTGIGLVLIVIGAAVIYFLHDPDDPPIVKWLETCLWGKFPEPFVGRQTRQLIELAFGPSANLLVRNRVMHIRVRPGFFVEGESDFKVVRYSIKIETNILVTRKETGKPGRSLTKLSKVEKNRRGQVFLFPLGPMNEIKITDRTFSHISADAWKEATFHWSIELKPRYKKEWGWAKPVTLKGKLSMDRGS